MQNRPDPVPDLSPLAALARPLQFLFAFGIAIVEAPLKFFQPTRPYESRGRGFAWQAIELVAANFWVAPQVLIWLAAQRTGDTASR